VYGQNEHNEQEVVVAGTAWKKWDTWRQQAPTFKLIVVKGRGPSQDWLIHEGATTWLDLTTYEAALQLPHWLSELRAEPVKKLYQEEQHPRDEKGQWTDAGGGATSDTYHLTARVRAALAHEEALISEQPVEYGVFVDPRDGTVSASLTDGNASTILIPDRLLPDLQGKIFTHNHPSHNSLSLQDAAIAQLYNVVAMRAVTPGGTTYMLARNGSTWPATFQSTAHALHQVQHAEWEQAIREGKMDVLTASATHYDVLWGKVAAAFPGEVAYLKKER